MQEISISDFKENPFTLIGDEWFLITTEKDGKTNTMTASWGGLGVMWNRNVISVYIRPSRYTKQFVDFKSKFSVCVLPKNYRDVMSYCGKYSGRDKDKISECKLTVAHGFDTVWLKESRLVFICRKLYVQPMDSSMLLENDLKEKFWKDDIHTLYIAEIEKILLEN